MTVQDADGMTSDFHRWEHLTDAYALQLEALRLRQPGASAELMRICRELEKYPTDFGGLVDLVQLQRSALEESRSRRKQ